MLQNQSATTITTAEMEQHVWKIFRIILTRARVCQVLPASTAKLVSSHVTFLLHTGLCARLYFTHRLYLTAR